MAISTGLFLSADPAAWLETLDRDWLIFKLRAEAIEPNGEDGVVIKGRIAGMMTNGHTVELLFRFEVTADGDRVRRVKALSGGWAEPTDIDQRS